MRPAIRVDKLSKRYRIGANKRPRDRHLRETISDGVRGLWKGLRGRTCDGHVGKRVEDDHEFWALKDVSFEVQPGEVVGIIGRNGAGKSTLLKILSQIVEPTSGRAEVRGRMGSLLEVGTGFHPELTGRENIFLNGSILGMSRREIDRKFDEIVDFSGVEQFLETPVKRYSSGMYVRLAFAVAAHLEPDILIVDEVLAVGDTAFQEKCMGQMQRTASQGRTILFVSHNMASIRQLCGRAILLHRGQAVADGEPVEVIHRYHEDARVSGPQSLTGWEDRDPAASGEGRIVHFDVTGPDGKSCSWVPFGGTLTLTLVADFHRPVYRPVFGVLVQGLSGEEILDLRSTHDALTVECAEGRVVLTATLDGVGLYPGEYTLSPWIMDQALRRNIDQVYNCRILQVTPVAGTTSDLQGKRYWGKYWVPSTWSCERPQPSTVGPAQTSGGRD
jgi:lipopolysaccharide transport system ATP-binding protein